VSKPWLWTPSPSDTALAFASTSNREQVMTRHGTVGWTASGLVIMIAGCARVDESHPESEGRLEAEGTLDDNYQDVNEVDCLIRAACTSVVDDDGRVRHEDEWYCELDDAGDTLRIDNFDPSLTEEHRDELESGRLWMRFRGVARTADRVVLLAGYSAAPILEFSDKANPAPAAPRPTGKSSLLVVRVTGRGSKSGTNVAPAASAEELSRSVFSSSGDDDGVSFASQVRACSYGKKTFVPATGTGIVGGVLDIHGQQMLEGLSLSQAHAKVKSRVESLIEGVQFDYIMYCLPTGLKGIAIAPLGSNWSAYNGKWCTSSEAQMHEVGHSLGLKHAMWKGDPYGDISGVMGASSNAQPRKCFNAFDSSMLGWYPEAKIDPNSESYWRGVLTSIADYGTAGGSRTVVLKLGKYHYLLYNRAIGINRDSGAFRDRVTVVRDHYETWPANVSSEAIAALGASEEYVFEDFEGSGHRLVIRVAAIAAGGASVEVFARAGETVTTQYEAESRSAAQGCAQFAGQAGFTGSGFMDFGGNGTWIEWNNISAFEAGDYQLSFRYANGVGGSRHAAILVNGSSAGSASFAPSGGWASWRSEVVKVRLRQGANTVRVQADTGNGGPNIDHVAVTPLSL